MHQNARMENTPGLGPADPLPQPARQGQGGNTSPPGDDNSASTALAREVSKGDPEAPPDPSGPAAASSVNNSEPRRRRGRIHGWIWVSVGIIVFGVRIYFVRTGILYGPSAVSQADAIVGALVVIGAAFIARGKTVKKQKRNDSSEVDRSTGQGWASWASGATALVAAGALVVSLVNLVEPLNSPNLAMPACPGARDRNVLYTGITAGVYGDNSRQGPGLSYLPDGRFPEGCSIGFSVYCLGDSIGETGGASDETWVTSRWLLVAKQPLGWRSMTARIISGENPEPQFISDAFITPETSYNKLPLGASRQCPGTFPYPGKTILSPFNTRDSTFTAVSPHATNMGFAVWVPPRQGFLDSDTYMQLPPVSVSSVNNPGETAADGSKSVRWDYEDMLVSQLKPSTGNVSQSGHVVIMAIPCLAINIPALISTADVAVYQLFKTAPPIMSTALPKGLDMNRLALAACETSS
jgi:hypothetical protein